MAIPKHLQYSKTHEWVEVQEDGTIHVGVTDYAQDQMGDVVFIEFKEVGDEIEFDDSVAEIETVKAISDVESPVLGEIAEVNDELEDAPELINEKPYETWIVAFGKGSTLSDELMDADEYEAYLDTL